MPEGSTVHIYLTLLSTLALVGDSNTELSDEITTSLTRAWESMSQSERASAQRLVHVRASTPARGRPSLKLLQGGRQ